MKPAPASVAAARMREDPAPSAPPVFAVDDYRAREVDADGVPRLQAFLDANPEYHLLVTGNVRAERFWRALGYTEVRTRRGIVMGQRTNTVVVLVKPLAGGAFDDYFARVPRDLADAPVSALGGVVQ
jgi:hypothetical protein